MRYLNTIWIVAIFLLLFHAPLRGQKDAPAPISVEALLEQANTSYSRGAYEESIPIYLAVIERVGHSPAIHFNLGSAYARINDYGRAILHFQRARVLDPADGEILANLNHVYDLARLRPPERSALHIFSEFLHPDLWAWLGVTGFWACVGALCIPPLLKQPRRPAFGLAVACILLTGLSAAALAPKWNMRREAVVVTEGARLKIAPTESSPLLVEVAVGETLNILRRERGHFYVDNNRTQPGWISAAAIEPVIP